MFIGNIKSFKSEGYIKNRYSWTKVVKNRNCVLNSKNSKNLFTNLKCAFISYWKGNHLGRLDWLLMLAYFSYL